MSKGGRAAKARHGSPPLEEGEEEGERGVNISLEGGWVWEGGILIHTNDEGAATMGLGSEAVVGGAAGVLGYSPPLAASATTSAERDQQELSGSSRPTSARRPRRRSVLVAEDAAAAPHVTFSPQPPLVVPISPVSPSDDWDDSDDDGNHTPERPVLPREPYKEGIGRLLDVQGDEAVGWLNLRSPVISKMGAATEGGVEEEEVGKRPYLLDTWREDEHYEDDDEAEEEQQRQKFAAVRADSDKKMYEGPSAATSSFSSAAPPPPPALTTTATTTSPSPQPQENASFDPAALCWGCQRSPGDVPLPTTSAAATAYRPPPSVAACSTSLPPTAAAADPIGMIIGVGNSAASSADVLDTWRAEDHPDSDNSDSGLHDDNEDEEVGMGAAHHSSNRYRYSNRGFQLRL